jgi:hypothetical protein
MKKKFTSELCKCSFGVTRSKFSRPLSASTITGVLSNNSSGRFHDSIRELILNGRSNFGSGSSNP